MEIEDLGHNILLWEENKIFQPESSPITKRRQSDCVQLSGMRLEIQGQMLVDLVGHTNIKKDVNWAPYISFMWQS